MKERFSKILLTSVLGVLLGASMGQVSADQAGWSENVVVYDQSVTNNWNPGNCGWSEGCDFGCCKDPCFSVAFDWLYWNIIQEDADIGIADYAGGITPSVFVNAETKYFNYRYKSGFRLFASYHLPCDNVSLDFAYTYFHPRYSNTVTAPVGGDIVSTQLPGNVGDPRYTEISTSSKIKYDMYDLVLSKTIRCGECTKIRPYAGFRALVFKQQFSSAFAGTTAGNFANWNLNFPAYGVTLGAEGKWCFCNNVSLIGRLGASLLGGQPKHGNQWFTNGNGATTGVTYQNEFRKHDQIVSGWDGALGLAYDTECCCMPVDLAVGYEFQDWWNTSQRPRFVGVNGNQVTGDSASRFTVHGVFVRAGIGF